MTISPVGWQLLLKPMTGPEKVGSVFLTDATKEENKLAATVCEVISMGPDCYTGEKFVTRWCAIGDFVLVGKFAGSRFNYQGVEHRFLNDDQIIGITDDPKDITRVM